MRKAAAAFHHLHDPALDQVIGRQTLDPLAPVFDRALGDVAALALQQVRYRAQRRGLAGAVGTEQRDDAAFRNGQRHAFEHQDHMVIDDLDAIDVEQSEDMRTEEFRSVSGGHAASMPASLIRFYFFAAVGIAFAGAAASFISASQLRRVIFFSAA